MAASQLLGLESYVSGPQPESVSIHAEPLSWVVSVHNRLEGKTVAGYFGNAWEMKGLYAMPLPIGDDDYGDLKGLEVRLLCVNPQKKGSDITSEQTWFEMEVNQQGIIAFYQDLGVPTKSIKVRYARGSKLVSVNMAKGTLRMRNWQGDEWHPPEPNENESYDPTDTPKVHAPPEPNEERFWRLREQRLR